MGRKHAGKTGRYYLAVTFQDNVNEQCLLGIVRDWEEKYVIESRRADRGLVRLFVRLPGTALPQDVLHYLTSMDGVRQVLQSCC